MSSIPYEELPILEALVNIRNRLTALKKDSSQYIRAQDVMQIYQQVIKQITKLNAVRDEAAAASASSSTSPAPTSASTPLTRPEQDTPVSPLSPSISSALASHTGFASLSATSSSSNVGFSTSPVDPALSGQAGTNTPSKPAYTTTQSSSGASNDASPITNRVDTTLNDVFALLSLFFLTIGKSRESPALFSQLSCMKQLLDNLAESGIYTETDLKPFADRLKELREIIIRDAEAGRSPVQLSKLMLRKLEGCERVLHDLQGTLSVLSVELLPIHQRLISVRRQIAAAAAKPKPVRTSIKQLQEELRKIDSKRVDGKFLGPGGSSVPAGQAILVGILEECFEICHDITVRNDEVPMELQPIYDRLVEIKAQLEHLVLTHRWTLRETDLWNYQVSLKEIDRLRVNGKFVDSEGKQPEGQLVLLYLLRRCYGLIYRLVASSEPISEELMPISNKLSTVQKCLKEVSKYGGPFTMRDLYPYRLALHQIDSLRAVPSGDSGKEGVKKWLGRDGSVPEGQAILRAQYEEVEQTIEEMLNRQEDDDEEEYDEAADEDAIASGSESEADGNTSSVAGNTSGIAMRMPGSGINCDVGASSAAAARANRSGGLGDESVLASPSLHLGSGFSTPGFAPIQPWSIQTFTTQGQQAAAGANGLSRPPLKGNAPWSTYSSETSGISSSAGSTTGGATSASGSNAGDVFQLTEAAISPTPSTIATYSLLPPHSVSGLPQTETVTASTAHLLEQSQGQGQDNPSSQSQADASLSPTPVLPTFQEIAPQAGSGTSFGGPQPFFASVSPDRGLPKFFTTSQTLDVGGPTSVEPTRSGSANSSHLDTTSSVLSAGRGGGGGGSTGSSSIGHSEAAAPSGSVAVAAASSTQGAAAPAQGGGVDAARMMDQQRSASERTLKPTTAAGGEGGKGALPLTSTTTITPKSSSGPSTTTAESGAGTVEASAQTDATTPPAGEVDRLADKVEGSVQLS
ncbi:hypothetical protein V8E36_007434 [Tilletia maclaganii]